MYDSRDAVIFSVWIFLYLRSKFEKLLKISCKLTDI